MATRQVLLIPVPLGTQAKNLFESMPVDSKHPNILHCAVCNRAWAKRGRKLPIRCAYEGCRSKRWKDGTDRRCHRQDSELGLRTPSTIIVPRLSMYPDSGVMLTR